MCAKMSKFQNSQGFQKNLLTRENVRVVPVTASLLVKCVSGHPIV